MANRIYVKPAPGRHFVHAGHALRQDRMVKPEGELVPEVSYYLRGIRSGDLVQCDPPKPKPEAKKPEAPKAKTEPKKTDKTTDKTAKAAKG